MDKPRRFTLKLEWSNYARTAYFATVVPEWKSASRPR